MSPHDLMATMRGPGVLATFVRCRDCGRGFDLTQQDDHDDWHVGHDCPAHTTTE